MKALCKLAGKKEENEGGVGEYKRVDRTEEGGEES